VSNDTLDVSFLNASARRVRPPHTFTNDPDGWRELADVIAAAAAGLGPGTAVACGVESTSNMHKRVVQVLRAETRFPVVVHELNPRAVKHFSQALLRDVKTDRLDSQLIALFLIRMQPEPTPAPPDLFEELKEATRTRRRLIEERTSDKNRLHKLLRYHFPGYRTTVGKTLSKRLLVALAALPSPHLLLEQDLDTLADMRSGRGHHVGLDFAEALHSLAARAPRLVLPPVTRMVIETTAQRVLDLDAQISRLDEQIEIMVDDVFPNQVLTSIPGIGRVSVAAILAEIGDIRRFKSKRNFIGYCGLYPIVWESGEAKRSYRMTRKGNRMLKMTLLIASAAARQFNPVIAAFYARLRKRGKSTRAAGGALARKLAEIVFTLLVRNEPWSEEKATRGLHKSDAMLAPAA
jgi:transposase